MSTPLYSDISDMRSGHEPAPNGSTHHSEPPMENPFKRSGSTIRRTALTGTFIVAAAVVAFLFSRGTGEPAASMEHNHVAKGSAPALSPVELTPDQARRIGVTYTTVTSGPLESEIRTVAQVTFDETKLTIIAPKLEGWIETLTASFAGQHVRAGDPLLSIYSPMFVAAEQELLLASRLVKDVANGSDEAKASAAALLESARRRLLYWDIPPAEIERIEKSGEVVKTVVLRSPVSGVVVEKTVVAGQRIMTGDALYKIADLGVVWLEGEVFERDLPAIKLGQEVVAEFQALPGTTRRGRISYIYPTISSDTRTARVRVNLNNPGFVLKPGMFATIRVRSSGTGPVLSVPRSAVLVTGERNLVFVRRADGKLEPREVTPGQVTNDRVQVLAGLNVGETVVASATFLVDSESDLGSLLGGMGDMPGMDMTKPTPLRKMPASKE